jgi:hypothetical protein
MSTIRFSPSRWAAFALRPSLLRALWQSAQEGGASPSIAVTYADGTLFTWTGPDPVATLLRPGSAAIRALTLATPQTHEPARRAVFEAGDIFIENECALSGPSDFLAAAEPRLHRGIARSFWQYPDCFAVTVTFVFLFFMSATIACRRAGYGHLPGALQDICLLLPPGLLGLRAWLPPTILIAPTDDAFDRAATIRRTWLILAIMGGLLLPLPMLFFSRHEP